MTNHIGVLDAESAVVVLRPARMVLSKSDISTPRVVYRVLRWSVATVLVVAILTVGFLVVMNVKLSARTISAPHTLQMSVLLHFSTR